MENQYKVIVINKKLYKEFEITEEMNYVKLGTTISCEFRLNPDSFFTAIELELEKKESVWTINCSDELYISRKDMRKLMSAQIEHGDTLSLHYAASGDEVFEIRFMVNFESKVPNFNWRVDLSGRDVLLISDGQNADIQLDRVYGYDTGLLINRTEAGYMVEELHSKFGVYKNGQRIDKKSELKEHDFISVVDFCFYFKEDCIYFDKESIVLNGVKAEEVQAVTSSLNYPVFNRSTRLINKIPEEKIDILIPSAMPKKPEDNLAMTLLPALAMLVLTVVVRGFMSNTANSSFIIFSVCSMSMGIMTSVAAYARTRNKYKREVQERIRQYTAYIDDKRQEISKLRQEELELLNSTYHDLEHDMAVVDDFSPELFDRGPKDSDFLQVYIGRGKVESLQQVDYKEKEAFETDDALMKIPAQIVSEYQYIANAPMILDLKNSNAVGVIGNQENAYSFLKNTTVDIVTRHYYGDVRMVLLLDDAMEKYSWAVYLPHIVNNQGTRNLVFDNESKNIVFEALYKELTYRKERKDITGLDYLIILVMKEWGLKNHPLSQFIECASSINVTFVFFEQYAEQLPLCCDKLVELTDNGQGFLYDVKNKNDRRAFGYHTVTDDGMIQICKKLAPVYCEEISLESALKKNISLFELLHIYSVEDIDLRNRWEGSQVYSSMAVPIGINSKEEIVCLDLHEKAHGPHGLVAGTTGSGKSEILQTFILSAATLFHPYEISFVIIDFKGGGMVNQFKNLPHLIGAITNIDGREIDRSLKSIKAELLKRQTLFAEANVNHIDKYIKLFKTGKVTTALPHLVIIVDEFAELKAEQPEFMKELISAARIGRSLGVHLILATQKPSGQVNEQIWSNSKFKLCLKVQNKEDSNEVLKSPLAAEIKEPGRAYLQVGNNEIFELLQSAYSGAFEKGEEGAEKEFVISEVGFGGKRQVVFEQKKKNLGKSNRTQLEAIVDYVAEYCKKNDIQSLPDICMPPLPDCINIASASQAYELNAIPIGIYDDPDSQYQGEAKVNFCEENTLIIGASATGKTNLLQTIIRQCTSGFSPKKINIYIMDFGAMYLKNFEGLHHIGGVVTISDEEKLKNLFKLLMEEIQLRKARFLEMGISSFSAYTEAGGDEFPQIILMIDNFTAFKEVYADSQEDNFIYITREGIACGISVIVANSQTSGLGYKYLSNFACRMAFSCNDSSEYSTLFERCRIKPKEVQGRALCKQDKELFELQTYLAFEGEKEIERSEAIKEYIANTNAKYAGEHAKAIPEIPGILTYQYIEDNYHYKKKRYEYPIALDYASVDLVTLDFRQINELCIVGNERSGRMRALETIFQTVEENLLFENVKAFIIDNIERPLRAKADAVYVDKYTIDVSILGEIIEETAAELEKRYQLMINDREEELYKLPMYLIVVNAREAIEYVSAAKSILEGYNKIVKQYKTLGVCFVFSDIDDVPVAYGGPELMKRFKENKKALITTVSLKEFKFCEIPANVVRASKALKSGDAYWLNGANVQRIKMLEVNQ